MPCLSSHPLAFQFAAAAKSLQSCLTLCSPIDGSPPAPPSLGFSRQEHWSGLPLPSPPFQFTRQFVSCPRSERREKGEVNECLPGSSYWTLFPVSCSDGLLQRSCSHGCSTTADPSIWGMQLHSWGAGGASFLGILPSALCCWTCFAPPANPTGQDPGQCYCCTLFSHPVMSNSLWL